MYGLYGSGEFLPWAKEVDSKLVESSSHPGGKVLILPTASAPEGDDVFNDWGNKGLKYYKKLGISAEVLPLKTRDDASRTELIEKLADASMVYFSGGNPFYLASTLHDTPFWRALLKAQADGLSFGGCSAGINFLGTVSFDTKYEALVPELFRAGVGLFKNTVLCPHWDAFDNYVPGATDYIKQKLMEHKLVCIDEATAILGDGKFTVYGRGRVVIYYPDRTEPEVYEAGQSLVL